MISRPVINGIFNLQNSGESALHVIVLDDSFSMGGSGDPSILTALGLYVGMQAALKKKLNINSMKGLKVGIQGLGKVGYYLCENLKKDDVKIYGYDIDKGRLDQAVEDHGVIPVSNDELLSMDLDIFSPCALGAVINPFSLG